MADTTDTLARPVFPPPQPRPFATAGAPGDWAGQISQAGLAPTTVTPPIPAPGGWPGQISQAGPTLPTVTPHVPRPASVDTNPFASAAFAAPAVTKPAKKRGGFRRAVRWLFLLAVLGGLTFAGFTYGPQLIDRGKGDDESGGPAAPLVYPTPTAPPVTTRTASFTVSEPDPFGGTTEYEVTTDFDSGVSRILIPRTDGPGIEILTLWDQSFIRRVDEPTWYTLPRGEFPVDYSFGRSRWIRTLDELVPPAIRQFTTIDEATESSVGTEPARRLVVSADADQLLQAQTAASNPTADGSPPPAPPFPAGITVEPAPEGVEELTMELWIDANGLVRKSVLPTQLGGQTITVTSVSADPFEPSFPGPEMIAPLTAQALFHLGL